MKVVSRREALKAVGSAGAASFFPPRASHAQDRAPLTVGGRSVEIAVTQISARTAILPLGPVKQYTEEKVDGPLTLQVCPGKDGDFLLY
jgi:hypothetical protein